MSVVMLSLAAAFVLVVVCVIAVARSRAPLAGRAGSPDDGYTSVASQSVIFGSDSTSCDSGSDGGGSCDGGGGGD